MPLATVATLNIPEAERLTGISIRKIDDAKDAAIRISGIGAKAVVIKGGHLEAISVVDILYYDRDFKIFESPVLKVGLYTGQVAVFQQPLPPGLRNE